MAPFSKASRKESIGSTPCPAALPAGLAVAPGCLLQASRRPRRKPAASAAVSGARDNLDAMVERHQEALWRLALRMAGEPDTAADLVQETFLRAMTRRLPPDLRSAEAWLVRTLVNLSRDLFRWRRVRESHADAAARATAASGRTTDPESPIVARLTVERALARLSARRRAVVVLHDLEGLDARRVGELVGIRPATVRWHLAVARRQLARWLATGDREAP